MCFTPVISLSIAIIEFVLAWVLIFLYPRSKLRNFFALFIVMLGSYQLSQYFLCISQNPEFWAAFGIIVYSFLPACGLHATLKSLNKRRFLFFIYIIPVTVSLVAIFTPGFILRTECAKFFISVSSILNYSSSTAYLLLYLLFVLYYAVFLLLIIWMMLRDYDKQKNKIIRQIELAEFVGFMLMIIPTFVLLIIFPAFDIMFPSILCEFAIFVAIAAFIGAHLESKMNGKKLKRTN